jgi:hypothetical protein
MLEGKCNETFADNPILLDTCIGLVDVTVRDIIEILEGGLEPESVCGLISLCDSDSNKTITYFKNRKAAPHGILECTTCKTMIKAIEGAIGIGHLEEDIINFLTGKCKEYLIDYPLLEDTCEVLVNTFVKDILDLIKDGLEPEHICQLIGMCDTPTTEPPPTTTAHHPYQPQPPTISANHNY